MQLEKDFGTYSKGEHTDSKCSLFLLIGLNNTSIFQQSKKAYLKEDMHLQQKLD